MYAPALRYICTGTTCNLIGVIITLAIHQDVIERVVFAVYMMYNVHLLCVNFRGTLLTFSAIDRQTDRQQNLMIMNIQGEHNHWT